MENSGSSGRNQIKQETETDIKQNESENTSLPNESENKDSSITNSDSIKSGSYNKSGESCIIDYQTEDTDDNDEEDSKEVEDEYDFMEECTIYPGQDRRQKIYESPYMNEGIIQCIGSIITRYRDNALTKMYESTWGTGTVIHIDSKNRCYILSAAHNTHKPLRQCIECHTKTLSTKCKCNTKTKKVSPTQLIEAESIDFQRRCVEGGRNEGYKFGVVIESYAVDEWKIPDSYKHYTEAYGGYDFCIMVFQCRGKGIDVYKSNCSDIELVCDPSFGKKNEENPVCIFGYPGDKDKQNEMWGMSVRRDHKLKIATHEPSGKAYILNPDIDTTPGQSGAAIWSWCDEVPTSIFSFSQAERRTYHIYGVHTGGCPGSKKRDRGNVGSFIDVENLKWIKKQIKGLRTRVIEAVNVSGTTNKTKRASERTFEISESCYLGYNVWKSSVLY